jgi:4'-phosphopantetheinyl transferase
VAEFDSATTRQVGFGNASSDMNCNFHITTLDALPKATICLGHDEVHLWRGELEALCGHEPHWKTVLSPDELKRADRFHFARDRQRFVAARALLRTILASYLDTAPSDLSFVYSKKEKPSLASAHSSDVTFNISHSGGIALFAFALGREIGVDVEQVRSDFDLDAIARRFFSEHEQNQLAGLPTEAKAEAFFRCWTRKEAYIKATGDGLSLPLSQFDVSLEPGKQDALFATRPDASEAARWLLGEVPAGSGYIGAICVRGRNWKLQA